MMNIMEDDQSLDEVNATISDPENHKQFHIPVIPSSHHEPHHKDAHHDDYPTVTTHELPAPYGCRYLHTLRTLENVDLPKLPGPLPPRPAQKCQ